MKKRNLLLAFAACSVGVGGFSASAYSHSSREEIESRCDEVGVPLGEPTSQFWSRESAQKQAQSHAAARARRHARDEQARREKMCSDRHGTPLFLRADLAYTVTGIDCFGNVPNNYSTVSGNPPMDNRAPASSQLVEPDYEPQQ